jgi:hypothetical protein
MIGLSVLEDIVDTIQKISESRSKTCISKDFFWGQYALMQNIRWIQFTSVYSNISQQIPKWENKNMVYSRDDLVAKRRF